MVVSMQIKFQEKISSCQCQVFMHIWEVKIVLIHRRTGSLIIEFSYICWSALRGAEAG
jgi:hypothetical protein